jgi:tetratricopeptide (TPR) repeat protein
VIERLVHVLRAVSPEVTAEQVADALWLAEQTSREPAAPPAPPATGRTTPAVTTPPAGTGDRAQPEPAGIPEPAGEAEPVAVPPPATLAPASAELTIPPPRPLARPDGMPTRSPAVPALGPALPISHALRPLRRRRPSRTATRLDEEATATQAAEADVWVPVMRRGDERWLDVALLVDDSASMVIWRRTVAELYELLVRQAAFRDVRVLRFSADQAGDEPLRLHPAAIDADGYSHRPAELVDPTGRRMVLVVSDGIGEAWRGTAITGALARWAHSGPVAILQPLPQRLWSSSGLDIARTTVRSVRPGLPNDQLDIGPVPSGTVPPGAGAAVPVLEIEPRWLRRWASIVAGRVREPVVSAVIFAGGAAGQSRPGMDTTIDAGIDPADSTGDGRPEPEAAYADFLASASTNAIKLAKYLSGAPLNLPVMRLVQNTMLPESRPSDLAELFLSGLLTRVTPVDVGVDPEDVEYDFQKGIRARLLKSLPRADALRVLSEASAFVSSRLGSPLDFRALLTPGAERQRLSPPFARVAFEVLRSLGGRYAEAAESLWDGGTDHDGGQRGDDMKRPDIATVESGEPVPPPTPDTDMIRPDPEAMYPSAVTVTTSTTSERRVRSVNLPAVWGNVPLRNNNFTGREAHLENLHNLLARDEQAALVSGALYGMGGVGKTQLAVEYVYRYSGEYDLVWWVPSEDRGLIRKSLYDLAERLEVAHSADTSRAIDAVREALRVGRPYERWLLVFDNAEHPETLQEFMPTQTAGGHVIVTSRNHAWAALAQPVEVDVFRRVESIELLQRRLPDIIPEHADKLADKLGDLPLALEQAAAWQAETGMSVPDYLRLFDTHVGQLMAESAPASYPTPVAASWALTFERLREQQAAAAELLELLAFFGAEPVSVALLRRGHGADVSASLNETLRDEIRLRRALRDLRRYALAKVDAGGARIQVHRLVQAVLRDSLPESRRHEMRDAVHAVLARANPGDPDTTANWDALAEIAPHVLPTGIVQANTVAARQVALDQVRYHYMVGDYETSRELGEVVVEAWQGMEGMGPDDEQTLIASRHLGNTLRLLGEYEKAREVNADTLERLRRVFGPDHEHTLNTARSVGSDLRAAGEFSKAEQLDEETLRLHQQVFGEDDPQTFRAANNLGVDYRLLGRFNEARQIDDDTLAQSRMVVAEENPYTLGTIRNVVHDLYGLGFYAEALRRQEDVMPYYTERLRAGHNELLLADRNIAIALRKLGRHREAVAKAELNHAAYLRRFGPDHEYTLAIQMSLANALRDDQQLEKARELAERALASYKRRFSPEHPFTLACTVNLAIIQRALGDLDASRVVEEETHAVMAGTLGEEHPYTLCCASGLTNTLAGLTEHRAARELSERTLERSRRARGHDHPYTLACATNLALDLRATGDLQAGEELLGQTLELLKRRLGPTHPETLEAGAAHRLECDIEPPPT